MALDYCTIAEVKAVMPDVTWSTAYDALLTTLVTRASRMFDRHVKRWPGYFAASADEIRYFDGVPNDCLMTDEMAAAPTSVAVAESGVVDTAGGSGGSYTTWSPTDYRPWPYNALLTKEPYRMLIVDQLNGSKSTWYAYPKGVKITGKFGYSTSANLPDEVKQAAIVQTVRWLKRGQQAFQDAGAIVELGQLTYVQKVDPDIAVVLDNLMEVTI
jgi:hypothetical protein